MDRIAQLEVQYKNKMSTKISYSDFLTKVVNIRKEIKEEDVKKAFEQLDVDKSGKIEARDLNSFLQRRGNEEIDAKVIFNEIDKDPENSKLNETDVNDTSYDTTQREEIGYGTFKEYLLDNGNRDSSEFDPNSVRSSFMNSAEQEKESSNLALNELMKGLKEVKNKE